MPSLQQRLELHPVSNDREFTWINKKVFAPLCVSLGTKDPMMAHLIQTLFYYKQDYTIQRAIYFSMIHTLFEKQKELNQAYLDRAEDACKDTKIIFANKLQELKKEIAEETGKQLSDITEEDIAQYRAEKRIGLIEESSGEEDDNDEKEQPVKKATRPLKRGKESEHDDNKLDEMLGLLKDINGKVTTISLMVSDVGSATTELKIASADIGRITTLCDSYMGNLANTLASFRRQEMVSEQEATRRVETRIQERESIIEAPEKEEPMILPEPKKIQQDPSKPVIEDTFNANIFKTPVLPPSGGAIPKDPVIESNPEVFPSHPIEKSHEKEEGLTKQEELMRKLLGKPKNQKKVKVQTQTPQLVDKGQTTQDGKKSSSSTIPIISLETPPTLKREQGDKVKKSRKSSKLPSNQQAESTPSGTLCFTPQEQRKKEELTPDKKESGKGVPVGPPEFTNFRDPLPSPGMNSSTSSGSSASSLIRELSQLSLSPTSSEYEKSTRSKIPRPLSPPKTSTSSSRGTPLESSPGGESSDLDATTDDTDDTETGHYNVTPACSLKQYIQQVSQYLILEHHADLIGSELMEDTTSFLQAFWEAKNILENQFESQGKSIDETTRKNSFKFLFDLLPEEIKDTAMMRSEYEKMFPQTEPKISTAQLGLIPEDSEL